MEKKAVIDIGTNTAHLLIAEHHKGHIHALLKERFFTYLAENGMELIQKDTLSRLYAALATFKQLCDLHHLTPHIVATDALRNATNCAEILNDIDAMFGWQVQLISGAEEAIFISKGAMSVVDMSQGNFLIVDVGGGSVEFVHVQDGQIMGLVSEPIGIARLYNAFHEADPLTKGALLKLEKYIDSEVKNIYKKLKIKPLDKYLLVGCAGTFEIFIPRSLALEKDACSVKSQLVFDWYDTIKSMDIQSRRLVDYLPADRAKYIIEAFALVRSLLKHLGGDTFVVSRAALKEGVLINNFFRLV